MVPLHRNRVTRSVVLLLLVVVVRCRFHFLQSWRSTRNVVLLAVVVLLVVVPMPPSLFVVSSFALRTPPLSFPSLFPP